MLVKKNCVFHSILKQAELYEKKIMFTVLRKGIAKIDDFYIV